MRLAGSGHRKAGRAAPGLTGWPMHTGQTWALGSAPYWLAQLQKAFVWVLSCTCVSMPMTAS